MREIGKVFCSIVLIWCCGALLHCILTTVPDGSKIWTILLVGAPSLYTVMAVFLVTIRAIWRAVF